MAKKLQDQAPTRVPQLKDVKYEPRNQLQVDLAKAWPTASCIFLLGPAGTGKTSGAFGEALLDVLRRKDNGARTVFLTRPTVQVEKTNDLGFMPGDLRAKFVNWLPAFSDVLGGMADARLEALESITELVPIGFARGRTIRNGTLVCDEAQNLTYKELKLLITRVGFKGRIVLCGDADQCDLSADQMVRGKVPLLVAAEKTRREPDVSVLTATEDDQLRSDFVKRILRRL